MIKTRYRALLLSSKAQAFGVQPCAMPDLTLRADRELTLTDEGEMVAADGTDLDAWFKARRSDAPHWFERGGTNRGEEDHLIRISAADAIDPARYRAALREAERTGRPLKIEE